jgi:uncharacterized damage-inducible protein DinB
VAEKFRRPMANNSKAQCPLGEVWHLNNRINLKLLDALTDEQLASTIALRGKAVTSYFAHIHMARFYWLQRRAPLLAKRVKKLSTKTTTRAALRQALVDSGDAMGELFAQAEQTGQLKGIPSKLGPVGFLAYCVTHEGHHRGQILLHLKISKMPLDRATSYSLWYWNKI